MQYLKERTMGKIGQWRDNTIYCPAKDHEWNRLRVLSQDAEETNLLYNVYYTKDGTNIAVLLASEVLPAFICDIVRPLIGRVYDEEDFVESITVYEYEGDEEDEMGENDV